jgi:CHAT domain-containing protein
MYDSALLFYKKTGDIESESLALHSKAKALVKLVKKGEALELFERVITNLEKVRMQIAFSEMKRTFLEKVSDQYEETVLFMLENKYYYKAFKYAESMRGRVLLDQMAEGLVRLEKGLKAELKEERDRLVGKLSALSRQIQETGGKDEKKLQELKEEYHQLESQFEDLLIKIRLENPLYASVNYPQPVTVRELQTEVLKKGETLLSFFISPEKAYVFIVSREKFRVKQLKVKEKEINGYVERYLHAIKENNTNDVNRFGSKLYGKLFKPLENYLKENRDIIIVPSGKLETIPFESLIIYKNKSGQPVYLLGKYRLKYVQSASLMSILRKHYSRDNETQSFIGFGDPVYDWENFKQGKPEQGSIFSHEDTRSDTKEKRLTSVSSVSSVAIESEIKEIHRQRYARAGGIKDRLPYSGEEIKTIARLFEKESLKTVVHLREQAAEANAKAVNMKDFDYIHFSCHGLLNDDFQSLVLSQLPPDKSKEDGYFTLNEIMNCDYHAKLVVLSACETGSGKMYKGEGVTGLTRAVMYAGTPAVIASLWKVDDIATKELMVKFYKNLLENNLDKTKALRQAKLELLKNKKYHSPLFWSAFVMYGE